MALTLLQELTGQINEKLYEVEAQFEKDHKRENSILINAFQDLIAMMKSQMELLDNDLEQFKKHADGTECPSSGYELGLLDGRQQTFRKIRHHITFQINKIKELQ